MPNSGYVVLLLTPLGELKGWSTNIPRIDFMRFYAVSTFLYTSNFLARGESLNQKTSNWEKFDLPAFTRRLKYMGLTEDVHRDIHRFEVQIKEQSDTEMTAKSVFDLSVDGKVMLMRTEFDGPIFPIAGDQSSGFIQFERIAQ